MLMVLSEFGKNPEIPFFFGMGPQRGNSPRSAQRRFFSVWNKYCLAPSCLLSAFSNTITAAAAAAVTLALFIRTPHDSSAVAAFAACTACATCIAAFIIAAAVAAAIVVAFIAVAAVVVVAA
jgi:hypothetical protein